ncbi:RNA polymerase sigma factor [Massilia sp. X63]|uniref:RNA polymerase sigma factor n=1 Tax=Massilia sp. X63 TaxID=3237285 RepID=UPI0034DD6795
MLNPLQLNAWLRGAAQKDAFAFRELYEASSPRLYGLALRILHRRELAEEALQESFVSIWHHAGDYQAGLSAPMTWMSTIVRNKSFDLLRRLQVEVEIDGEDFDERVLASLRDPAANPAEALELSSEARALAACMSALEERHRKVVGLAFFHDLSHSDVAQKLALPVGTVKTWIRRSLARLQACLTGGGRAA